MDRSGSARKVKDTCTVENVALVFAEEVVAQNERLYQSADDHDFMHDLKIGYLDLHLCASM